MKKFMFTATCIIALIATTYSQSGAPGKESYSKKNLFSFNVGGSSPLFGINYERFLNPKFSADIGIGFFSIGLGFKRYINKIEAKKFNPFLGYSTTVWNIPFADGFQNNYFKLGLSYFNSKKLYFAFDAGPNLMLQGNNWFYYIKSTVRGWNSRVDIFTIPYGSIRIGKRF